MRACREVGSAKAAETGKANRNGPAVADRELEVGCDLIIKPRSLRLLCPPTGLLSCSQCPLSHPLEIPHPAMQVLRCDTWSIETMTQLTFFNR